MKKTITIMVLVMVMAIMSVVPVLASEEQSYDYLSDDMNVIVLWSYEKLDSDEGMYLPYYVFTEETMPDSIESLNEDIDEIREDGGMVTIVENEDGYYDLYLWDPETQPSPMECGLWEEA